MSALPLQPAVFTILRDLIQERAGLRYGPDDLPLLRDKLSSRAIEAGFDSLLDYYYFLRYDPGSAAHLQAMLDDLVVNETYLFRELEALEQVVSSVLLPTIGGRRHARVWSAACSTGEECFTLAMILAREGVLDQVEILASDLSTRALERARAGQLGGRALRGPIPPSLARYLSVEGSRVAVSAAIRDRIHWQRLNLLEPKELAALGRFDVILCRNVLIYFSDDTARSVVSSLTDRLVSGGVLVVGTSESLLRYGTSLLCEERGGSFFYRKAS